MTGLAVLRSLGRSGVPAFVVGGETANVARSRWYRSAPGEAIEETSDGERVTSYLRTLPFPRAVLIPTTDEWTLALASLPEADGAYPATVAPAEAIGRLIDKERLAETAEGLGVPIPRTIPVRAPEDLDSVPENELGAFFLKPANSQLFARRFGVKALRLAGRGDAAQLLAQVASEGLEALLQEFIPGPPTAHVFLDGYVDRAGVMRACLARRRLRMYPAEFGNSTLSVTIPRDEVAAAVDSLRRLFEGVGYSGLFDAEFKYDARDGQFKLFEVNVRPWWQLELAGASGLDLCLMAYRDAAGLPLGPVPDYRVGRTWVHPLLDLKAWRAGRGSGGAAGGFPLRSWFGGANALFSWDDPKPGIEQLAHSVRGGVASAWRRRSSAAGRPTPRPAGRRPPPAGGSGAARQARRARCRPRRPSGRRRP